MSCAGNADLSTPAMDRLAASGVRFENAYCPFPLCLPCRASTFTGKTPHELGIESNHADINADTAAMSLGRLLGEAGYECAYGGKTHLPKVEGRPAGEAIGPAPEWGWRRIAMIGDEDLPAACINYLQQPRKKPFFLVASFNNPHNICEWARQQGLPDGPIPREPDPMKWPNLPANYEVPPFEPAAIRREVANNQMVHPQTMLWEPEHWRAYRYAYFRMCEKVDAQIGHLLRGLDDLRLTERTLIVFVSDHGDGHGAHRLNQKWTLYDESVRVPLIVSGPGVANAGRADRAHLVNSGLDIIPTFCDYAQVATPHGLEGRSLRGLIEGQDLRDWRTAVFSETSFAPAQGHGGTRGRMVRTQRYKYAAYSWGRYREQLIDLNKDPGEMVNLAVEARHGGLLAEHRALLADWIKRTGDRFIDPLRMELPADGRG
jgi:arylsulfatase A-like enzyme